MTPHETQYTTILAPLTALRAETVLARLPIHNLAKKKPITISITQTNRHRAVDLHWSVSYNSRYGQPGPLAYKLDTLFINRRLEAVGKPLPVSLCLGSLREIARHLALGNNTPAVKTALLQNAATFITAKLVYTATDGTKRWLDASFTRYSVVFTGERLPDGTTADAVYLLLNDPYRDVLHHAPVRPLDYDYLTILPPMAQRFYELVSFKIFAALKYGLPTATLGYAAYCLFAPQQRYTDPDQVKKQMYKLHRPHLTSDYLAQVRYEATTDDTGQPDWLLHYTPGSKARAEYAAFRSQPGAAAPARALPADAAQEDLLAPVPPAPPAAPPAAVASPPPSAGRAAREAPASPAPQPATTPPRPQAAAPAARATPPADPLQAQAVALVQQFYQRFAGRANVTPGPKELAQARALLAQHGAATAHFFVDFSHQAAGATQYQPQTFMGIEPYLDRALAAYQARATQVAAQRAAADERTQHEQHRAWEHRQLEHLRAALPPAALAALEGEARARLVAAGTPAVALPLAVRVAVDQGLAAQAGLPAFEAWRQMQEAGG
jgi:hypothetical protein